MKKLIYQLPFFAILLLVSVFFLQNQATLPITVDSNIFLSKQEALHNFFSMWGRDNLGYVANLKLTTSFYQLFYSYLFWHIFPNATYTVMYAFFYLLILNLMFYISWRYIYKSLSYFTEKPFLPSILAVSLYNFSTFVIFLTAGGVIDGIFHIFCLLPLLTFYCIKSIKEDITLSNSLIIALAIGLTINSFAYSFAVYLVLAISFLPFVSRDWIKQSYDKVLIILLLATGVGALFFFSIFGGVNFHAGYDPAGSGLSNYIFLKKGLLDGFRLFFDWFANEDVAIFNYGSFYFLHTNPLSTLLIFFLWIQGILTFWKLKNNSKTKSLYLFLLLVGLISIFFVKGGHAPFGTINYWLYEHIPFFGIFRTPGTKFGLLIFYVISLLVGVIYATGKKRLKYIILVTVLLLITPYFIVHPRFSFHTKNSRYPSVINSEVQGLITYIQLQNNPDRILHVPGISNGNFIINGTPYSGPDIIGRSIENPNLYEDGFAMPQYIKMYRAMVSKLNPDELGEFSIRYVLIRNDYSSKNYPYFKKIREAAVSQLNSNPLFKLKYKSKSYLLYEVNETYIKSSLTIHKKNGSVLSAILDSQLPYKFDYSIPHELIEVGDILVFNSLYHPQWILSETTNLKVKTINTSKYPSWVVLKTSNTISKQENVYKVTIEYEPQKYLYYGAFISSVTIVTILIALFFLRLRNKGK